MRKELLDQLKYILIYAVYMFTMVWICKKL